MIGWALCSSSVVTGWVLCTSSVVIGWALCSSSVVLVGGCGLQKSFHNLENKELARDW